MRRPNTALMMAVLVAALSASMTRAQQSPGDAPPDPDREPRPIDSMSAARGPRQMLRHGREYIGMQEYETALKYLREAEDRQKELTPAERRGLQEAIRLAQRGLRGAEPASATTVAKSPTRPRPGTIALAPPAQDADAPDSFQLASGTSEGPTLPEAGAAQSLPELPAEVAPAAGPGQSPPSDPEPLALADLPPVPPGPGAFVPLVDEPVGPAAPPEPLDAAPVVPAPEPEPAPAAPEPAPAAPEPATTPTPPELPAAPAPAVNPVAPSPPAAATVPETVATPELPPPSPPTPAPESRDDAPLPPDPSTPPGGSLTPEPPMASLPPLPEPGPAPRSARGQAPRVHSFLPRRTEDAPSILSPELQAEVKRKAAAEQEATEAQQRVALRQMETEHHNPRRDLGAEADPSTTRLEIPRAPSPTEARPLKAIIPPDVSDFVPSRQFPANRKYWAASATCHGPLYFQDAALERYGQSVEQAFGPAGRFLSYPIDDPKQSNQRNQILQPFASIGLFASQIVLLPYNLVVDPPWEAEYDLGYHRPGDRIPPDTIYLPTTGVGPPLRGRNY